MDWIKVNVVTDWYSYISSRYRERVKQYKNYRCKILGIEADKETGEISLWVMISGIKNQILRYLPKELIVDDLMLGEFSPFDARAITFYAIMQAKYEGHFCSTYYVAGQDFFSGKTIFIIKELINNREYRKSARELYSDMGLLSRLSQKDLINVVSTAIQEQTMEDLQEQEDAVEYVY